MIKKNRNTTPVRDVDDMIYGEHCETIASER